MSIDRRGYRAFVVPFLFQECARNVASIEKPLAKGHDQDKAAMEFRELGKWMTCKA